MGTTASRGRTELRFDATSYTVCPPWQACVESGDTGRALVITPAGAVSSAADLQLLARLLKNSKRMRHPALLAPHAKASAAAPAENTGIFEAAVPLTVWCRAVVAEMSAQPVQGPDWLQAMAAGMSSPGAPEAALLWGWFGLLRGIEFLHASAAQVHGSISPDSVWVCPSGDWKLGSGAVQDSAANAHAAWADVRTVQKLVPAWAIAPDRARGGGSASAETGFGWDMWAAGATFLWASLSILDATHIWADGAELADQVRRWRNGELGWPVEDPAVAAILARCCAMNPAARPAARAARDAIGQQPVCQLLAAVDELHVLAGQQRAAVIAQAQSSCKRMPALLTHGKVVPALMRALEFSDASAGGTAVLGPALQLAAGMPAHRISEEVLPSVLRLFKLKDRATRMQLLHYSADYAQHLTKRVVNDQIWPELLTGFHDAEPALRQATAKATVNFLGLLSDSNAQVLTKALRRTALDPAPAVRATAVVALSRVSRVLSATQVHSGVIPTYLKSMTDATPAVRATAYKVACNAVETGLMGQADAQEAAAAGTAAGKALAAGGQSSSHGLTALAGAFGGSSQPSHVSTADLMAPAAGAVGQLQIKLLAMAGRGMLDDAGSVRSEAAHLLAAVTAWLNSWASVRGKYCAARAEAAPAPTPAPAPASRAPGQSGAAAAAVARASGAARPSASSSAPAQRTKPVAQQPPPAQQAHAPVSAPAAAPVISANADGWDDDDAWQELIDSAAANTSTAAPSASLAMPTTRPRQERDPAADDGWADWGDFGAELESAVPSPAAVSRAESSARNVSTAPKPVSIASARSQATAQPAGPSRASSSAPVSSPAVATGPPSTLPGMELKGKIKKATDFPDDVWDEW